MIGGGLFTKIRERMQENNSYFYLPPDGLHVAISWNEKKKKKKKLHVFVC